MEKKGEKMAESRLMANTPEFQMLTLKKTNDDMRKHITKLKADLEQEKNRYKKLKRERVIDIRTARETEYQRAMVAIDDLRNKLHQEKINELLAQKDTLTRQYEMEIKKIVKHKEDYLGKMQTELHKTKEDFLMKMRTRIAADAQDEARKKFDVERSKLLQEIAELKENKHKVETECNEITDAERRKSAEMKWIHDKHLLDIEQLKKETRRDICRLVEDLKKKDKVISDLEKEVGHHFGNSRKLQAEKESLKGELSNALKMADTWERSSTPTTPGRCTPTRNIPSPRPPALGRLTPEGKLKKADFTSERKKLNKHIQGLEDDKQKLEDKCKVLNDENRKLTPSPSKLPIRRQESQGYGSRRSSSTDSSAKLTQSLSDDNSETEKLKKQMDDNFKTITELKNQIIEKDRRLDLIQHRRRKARKRQSGIVESSPKGLEDDIGLDTASITSSISQRSDNTSGEISGEWDEFERAELEDNYQQLSKEYLQLKKAYSQLQAMIGGTLDVQREYKLREQLELDLLDGQAKIEDLQKILQTEGKDYGWVEEKQKIMNYNRNLESKMKEKDDEIKKIKHDLDDSQDQSELLEFRILELEERAESAHTAAPESLSSLSPMSSTKMVGRPPSPAISALPIIQVTETDGETLQIAVNEEGFTDMSVVEIKQKLDDIASSRDDDRLSVEDKKTLLKARAMLDIADLKLKKMTSTETSLKRRVMDLEHEKDRLAAKVSSMEVELKSKLSALDDSNKKIDELEEVVEQMKKSEAKLHAQEKVYLKNETKLKEEINLLKKQMSTDREGREYENELLFQKISEVKDEKQKVAVLQERNLELEKQLDRVTNSKLQETLDSLVKADTMATKETQPKQIELKSIMTLEELQHLKMKVDEMKEMEMKICKMEQTELVLREHIQALEEEILQLQENIQYRQSSHDERVEEYEIRQQTLKERSRKAERAQVELKEQLEVSMSEESKKDKENEELKRKLKNLETSESTLKEKVKDLEKEMISLHDNSDADTSIATSLNNEEINKIKESAHEISEKNQDLDVRLKQLAAENEKLKGQLNCYELSEKELKEQINQIRVENDVLKDAMQLLEIENKNLKEKSLPEKSTDKDAELLKMRDRIWELESSEKVLEAELLDLKEESERLKSKLGHSPELLNGNVSRDSQTMQEKIKDLETQENSMKDSINDLRESESTLKSELSKTASEKGDLLTMYQDALERIQELESGDEVSEPIVRVSVDEMQSAPLGGTFTMETPIQSNVVDAVEQPVQRVMVDEVAMAQNGDDSGLNNTMTLHMGQSLEDRVYELEASEDVLKTVVRDLQVSEGALKDKVSELSAEKQELEAKLKDAKKKKVPTATLR